MAVLVLQLVGVTCVAMYGFVCDTKRDLLPKVSEELHLKNVIRGEVKKLDSVEKTRQSVLDKSQNSSTRFYSKTHILNSFLKPLNLNDKRPSKEKKENNQVLSRWIQRKRHLELKEGRRIKKVYLPKVVKYRKQHHYPRDNDVEAFEVLKIEVIKKTIERDDARNKVHGILLEFEETEALDDTGSEIYEDFSVPPIETVSETGTSIPQSVDRFNVLYGDELKVALRAYRDKTVNLLQLLVEYYRFRKQARKLNAQRRRNVRRDVRTATKKYSIDPASTTKKVTGSKKGVHSFEQVLTPGTKPSKVKAKERSRFRRYRCRCVDLYLDYSYLLQIGSDQAEKDSELYFILNSQHQYRFIHNEENLILQLLCDTYELWKKLRSFTDLATIFPTENQTSEARSSSAHRKHASNPLTKFNPFLMSLNVVQCQQQFQQLRTKYGYCLECTLSLLTKAVMNSRRCSNLQELPIPSSLNSLKSSEKEIRAMVMYSVFLGSQLGFELQLSAEKKSLVFSDLIRLKKSKKLLKQYSKKLKMTETAVAIDNWNAQSFAVNVELLESKCNKQHVPTSNGVIKNSTKETNCSSQRVTDNEMIVTPRSEIKLSLYAEMYHKYRHSPKLSCWISPALFLSNRSQQLSQRKQRRIRLLNQSELRVLAPYFLLPGYDDVKIKSQQLAASLKARVIRKGKQVVLRGRTEQTASIEVARFMRIASSKHKRKKTQHAVKIQNAFKTVLRKKENRIKVEQNSNDQLKAWIQIAEQSALRLQCFWRLVLAAETSKFLKVSRAAMLLQKNLKKCIAQKQLTRHICTKRIQKTFKGFSRLKKASVIKVQQATRGFLARKHVYQKKSFLPATKVQRLVRCAQAKKKKRQLRVLRDGARRIQRLVRYNNEFLSLLSVDDLTQFRRKNATFGLYRKVNTLMNVIGSLSVVAEEKRGTDSLLGELKQVLIETKRVLASFEQLVRKRLKCEMSLEHLSHLLTREQFELPVSKIALAKKFVILEKQILKHSEAERRMRSRQHVYASIYVRALQLKTKALQLFPVIVEETDKRVLAVDLNRQQALSYLEEEQVIKALQARRALTELMATEKGLSAFLDRCLRMINEDLIAQKYRSFLAVSSSKLQDLKKIFTCHLQRTICSTSAFRQDTRKGIHEANRFFDNLTLPVTACMNNICKQVQLVGSQNQKTGSRTGQEQITVNDATIYVICKVYLMSEEQETQRAKGCVDFLRQLALTAKQKILKQKKRLTVFQKSST